MDWKKAWSHRVFFMKKPKLVMRIANGYFQTLVMRRDRLRSVEMALTYACQAKCHKCYSANLFDKSKKPLSIEDISRIWKQCLDLGAIHVNLTGGEPTLRSDLVDIIKTVTPDRNMVSLVSNCMKIEEDMIAAWADAGLNTLQASLDSATPEVHDELRGMEGCFDKVIQAARWCHKHGINICFSTVLSPESTSNKEQMWNLLQLCERENAFLLICDSASVGGWEGQSEKMLTREQRNEALMDLLKHPRARHHNLYNFRGRQGCPAGVEKIYITAYGEVTPCDLMHESFGNVLQEPLEGIWRKMCEDPRFAQKTWECVRYLPDGIDPNCAYCKKHQRAASL
jgi:MoaA/NifB/PqqE/SkfB family radical SAM enzyme